MLQSARHRAARAIKRRARRTVFGKSERMTWAAGICRAIIMRRFGWINGRQAKIARFETIVAVVTSRDGMRGCFYCASLFHDARYGLSADQAESNGRISRALGIEAHTK